MSEWQGKATAHPEGSEDEALAILRKYLGHSDFRPGQRDVIDAILSDRDVLAVLPTGTGKSVCYQLPAVLRPGLTLVISPLIALMRDQVDGLQRRGIAATYINSTLSAREVDQRLTDSEFGRYRLLYLAPERLSTPSFATRCGRLEVNTVVIDEAHCVSEWGHAFRPSYLTIADAVDRMGGPVIAALTATATPRVRADIVELLRLRNPSSVVTGFDRPNIEWGVYHDGNKRRRVLTLLHEMEGSAVLYVGTRRGAEDWDSFLKSRGVESVHYHGGLTPDARERVQAGWMNGSARVMVATSAFGMGIDKPDVRQVIHVDLPLSLEAYYQEAGRAGRDNLPSRAALVYSPGDERLPRTLIEQSYPTPDEISTVYGTACSMGGIAVGTMPGDPIDLDEDEVARVAAVSVPVVRQASDFIERIGAWAVVPGGDFGNLRVNVSAEAIRSLLSDDRPVVIRRIATYLLRGRQAARHGSWVRVRPERLSQQLKMPLERIEGALKHLHLTGHVSWRPPGSTMCVSLLQPRHARLPMRKNLVDRSRRGALTRLDDLLRYASHRDCRRNYILTYFGQAAPARCGSCDNCRSRDDDRKLRTVDMDMVRAVIRAVRSGRRDDDWGLQLPWTIDEIDECVDWLVREGYLRVDPSEELSLRVTERGESLIQIREAGTPR
jgi:ATP-dependent DNA helicase RecQ